MATWYEDTPTVWAREGTTLYINFDADYLKKMLPKEAAEWVERASARGEFCQVVTRAAIPALLRDVAAKDIAAARIAASVLDVAAPSTGTAAAKLEAVRVKLDTIVPVAEYEKCAALAAAVVKVEKSVR